MGNINLDQNKLYLQLFNLFEKELLNIFEYIAPTEENMDTYGNRIHELLLRIGAEVENIAKGVCNYIAITKNEDINRIENATSEKFLKYLIENLSINAKNIQFTAGLDLGGQKYISPFSIKDWWENYDNLKHGKIENYNLCNLGNIIMALGGYYILLNYLLLGYNKTRECDNILTLNPSKNLGINSTVFIPTTTFDKGSFTLHLAYGDDISINESDVQSYNKKLSIINLEIPQNSPLKEHEYLFYTHFHVTPKISGLEYLKAMNTPEKKFKTNYFLKPEFGFIN